MNFATGLISGMIFSFILFIVLIGILSQQVVKNDKLMYHFKKIYDEINKQSRAYKVKTKNANDVYRKNDYILRGNMVYHILDDGIPDDLGVMWYDAYVKMIGKKEIYPATICPLPQDEILEGRPTGWR